MLGKMIDLHCDALYYAAVSKTYSLRSNGGHVSFEKMRAGGVSAQCFAIFTAAGEDADTHFPGPYEFYKAAVAAYDRELKANSDLIRPALCAADIKNNEKDGKLSAILTVENAIPLEGRIERLQEFFADGVRMMSFTWNQENETGYPNDAVPARNQRGLKPFGLECLSKMNELGIIADVSHLSEGGFWDVVRHSKKPFAASHSCARALCGHPRNLTDEQLRAIGDSGGVSGVCYVPEFLRPGSRHTTAEDVVRHIRYIHNVAGREAVAIGSDFDGFTDSVEWTDCSGCRQLREELNRYFPASDVDRICGGNFLRVLREVSPGE